MLIYHFSHRARAINAKNISSKSAAHISEILGIAPILSHSSSAIDSTELSGKLTSLTDPVETEKITTSTKSVADYFKEKLNTRSSSATVSTLITSDEACDTPRMGLGSRARLDIFTVTGEVEDQRGSSKFSALSSSLASEKRPKDLDLDDPATTSKVDTNPNTQIEKQKKKRKVKEEEIERGGSACEDKDETKEREERKRKRKLDKEKKAHVEPQDFDNDSKELKRQEKRARKAKKLQEYDKKPQKERKERKKAN
jgi:Pin2-interacting protein X1